MSSTPDEIDSTFRFILIAAKRAGQIIEGARPRIETRLRKPTTQALAELEAGAVPWRAVSPEEFEILRQEEAQAKDREEQPAPFLHAARPEVPLLEEPESEEEETEELDEDSEGPEFENGELGETDDSLPDELLGDEP